LTPVTANPTVRPAEAADVDTIVSDTWAVAEEGRWIGTEVPFDRAERRRMTLAALADPAREGRFVAEADGRIVGHIGLHLAGYGVVSLGMLVVEGYRGKGVGAALMARGVEWASAAGAHKVSLEVWPDNEAALALYQQGFEIEGRLRRHYRRRNSELRDALVMGLLL
jgi:RimJ/RimL family protein N-acetyltransferase